MEPSRCSERTRIVPPCAATIAETIDSPRPVPWIASFWAVEERKNFWKRLACSSAGIPMPVSVTVRTASSPCTSTRVRTTPPSSVNFTALVTRLSTTRSSWAGSPTTRTGCGARS